MNLRLTLIHRDALQRLSDAETLRSAWGLEAQSDSAYLLNLLGFELLLKLVYEVNLDKFAPPHHRYDEIFSKLPNAVQNKLIAHAGERVGPSALAIDCQAVLKQWARNFVALPYPWNAYTGLSTEQYAAQGEKWIARGARLEEATFRYYPEELVGMLAALKPLASELLSDSAGEP